MQSLQSVLDHPDELPGAIKDLAAFAPSLILVFAPPRWFSNGTLGALLAAFPDRVAGCSGAGQIASTGLHETHCVLTAVRFESAQVELADTPLTAAADSYSAGQRLGALLSAFAPGQVLVFSPGLAVDGTALVDGLQASLPGASLSGGLAADEGHFEQTWTLGPGGIASSRVVAVALKGPKLQVGHGCFGGWKPFGPTRKASACEGNLLLELDQRPALEVYRRYLGEHAQALPASALLFPLAILNQEGDESGLIRTIVGIDEARQGLILAGSVRQGALMRLMHASTEALVDGAEQAGHTAFEHPNPENRRLALLVTCIGRKLVMGDRTEDEIEAVATAAGPNTVIAGFYSFGEISPSVPMVGCHLHNETMAITALTEGGP